MIRGLPGYHDVFKHGLRRLEDMLLELKWKEANFSLVVPSYLGASGRQPR
jgi:hypothetical protein